MMTRISWILAATIVAAGAHAGTIGWRSDYQAGLVAARRTGKLVLLTFVIDWCPWCHRMEARTFADPRVVRAISSMVPVKLNAEGEGKRLAQRFHVTGFPAVLFVNGRGEVVGQVDRFEEAASFAMDVMKADRLYREMPLLRARLAQAPKDPEANARLAAGLAWKGMTTAAEAALDRAREAHYRGPDLAIALNAIGDNYQTALRFDQAIDRFAKANVSTTDPSVRSYALMSIMYCHISRMDQGAARKAARLVVGLKGADREWVDAANRYLEDSRGGPAASGPRAG